MAVISAVFVTFGVMLVFAFSGALFGNWFRLVPAWTLIGVPFLALFLGVLSGYQTVRQAYRKALKKAEETEAVKPVCADCGERLEIGVQRCPVCGRTV
jgi:hypothetical protein